MKREDYDLLPLHERMRIQKFYQKAKRRNPALRLDDYLEWLSDSDTE